MNRLMMLTLAVCLPFSQACDDTPQIMKKAEWVCQHTHVLDETHVLDLYPETHPIRDYVVDADVDFTERALDEEFLAAREHGRGWDVAIERAIMTTGRVATSHASCKVDALTRIKLGERYRVELTLDYEVPNAGAPLDKIVGRLISQSLEDEGLGDIFWLFLTEDISSMVPTQYELERIFEREWDREGVIEKTKKVTFDMIREDGRWKAELDMRTDRDEPEVVTGREEVVESTDEEVESLERTWEQVSSRWRMEVEESRERVERERTRRGDREESTREVRRESREVRVDSQRDDEERELRRRIERLEREVRRLERRRDLDDDYDIEIRF